MTEAPKSLPPEVITNNGTPATEPSSDTNSQQTQHEIPAFDGRPAPFRPLKAVGSVKADRIKGRVFDD